jgi:hypothetical protein
MAITYRHGLAASWYPGDDAVDWIGADGYNGFDPARPASWRSCAQIFDAFHAFARPRGKPLLLPEYGSDVDPADPGRRPAWLDDCRRWGAARPAVKLVSYFDAHNWALDSDGGRSLQALRAWAQDGRFRAGGR